MSERRACRVIGCQRMTVRYRRRRPDDPQLRERLVAFLQREHPEALARRRNETFEPEAERRDAAPTPLARRG